MALQAKYLSYLSHPSADAFADNASLNYVPTTTALTGPTTILRHLNANHNLVEKKSELFLNIIESNDSICVETETKLFFASGGGTYLPGLEDNFLAGKTVTLPITHIVLFNEQQKILQIRLLWDQACLLKAVDTIGAKGRNWPIRDPKDQLKMIVSSAGASSSSTAMAEEAGKGKGFTRGRDPHSTLSLFDNQNHTREYSEPNLIAPRQSARPPPREMGELFAGAEPIASPERAMSPTKGENMNPLKSGAGRHYQEHRLFNDESSAGGMHAPSIKTEPKKFQHFEFGEAEFKPKPNAMDKPKNKHLSQWDFADFSTPQKQQVRKSAHHEPTYQFQNEADIPEAKPNVFRQPLHLPRPDADAHFNFQDAPTPLADRSARPSTSSSSRSGLYEDRTNEHDSPEQDKMPLKNITNPNVHAKTFGSSWDTTSPDAQNDENKTVKGPSRTAGSTTFQSSWDFDQDSPIKTQKGIKVQGDGMGMRKDGEKNWWDFE